MEFAFTTEQEALRSSAREVLADKAGPQAYRRALTVSETGMDDALWRTITELGWAGVAVDEGLGGLGLGLIELAVLAEEMGRGIAAVPFFSTVGLAAQVLEQVDDGDEIRDALLRQIAAGERRASVVLGTEEGAFDPSAVTIRAVRAGSEWELHGPAALAPEAHVADDLIVVARAEGSAVGALSLFVVPVASLSKGLRPQPSLDAGRRLAAVSLEGVRAQLLGAKDAATDAVLRAIDRAAVFLAAEGVGVASAVLERSVAYARERDQFGRPIGSFQAVSHALADVYLWVETARSNVYYAAWALQEGAPDAHLAAATAKASAADAARLAANKSIQVHGGIGFTWEDDLHLYFRRAKFCELFLGAAPVWRERIAGLLAS